MLRKYCKITWIFIHISIYFTIFIEYCHIQWRIFNRRKIQKPWRTCLRLFVYVTMFFISCFYTRELREIYSSEFVIKMKIATVGWLYISMVFDRYWRRYTDILIGFITRMNYLAIALLYITSVPVFGMKYVHRLYIVLHCEFITCRKFDAEFSIHLQYFSWRSSWIALLMQLENDISFSKIARLLIMNWRIYLWSFCVIYRL